MAVTGSFMSSTRRPLASPRCLHCLSSACAASLPFCRTHLLVYTCYAWRSAGSQAVRDSLLLAASPSCLHQAAHVPDPCCSAMHTCSRSPGLINLQESCWRPCKHAAMSCLLTLSGVTAACCFGSTLTAPTVRLVSRHSRHAAGGWTLAATGVVAVHTGVLLAASRDSSKPACETILLPSANCAYTASKLLQAQDHWATAQARLTCRPPETPYSRTLRRAPLTSWASHSTSSPPPFGGSTTAGSTLRSSAASMKRLWVSCCPSSFARCCRLATSAGVWASSRLPFSCKMDSGVSLALWQCWQHCLRFNSTGSRQRVYFIVQNTACPDADQDVT